MKKPPIGGFLRDKGASLFLQRNGEHQMQAAEHHQRSDGGDQEAAADLAALLGQRFILMLILPADEKPSGTQQADYTTTLGQSKFLVSVR